MYFSEPVGDKPRCVMEKECIVYHCILRAIHPGKSGTVDVGFLFE